MNSRFVLAGVAASILFASVVCAAGAQSSPQRQRISIDFGWKFFLGDPTDAQRADFADAGWSSIDLPHDWSVAGPFSKTAPGGGGDGYLPTGIGWYRKTIKLSDADRNRRINIEFDGIYENSEEWINGISLGKRPSGYTSFIYDLTPHLKFDGSENVLAVRVDNSPQPNSRWYSGSGIYRHVWLLTSDDLHIPQWGTYVTTPNVSTDWATVNFTLQITNQRKTNAAFDLKYIVLDQQGNIVQTATGSGRLDGDASNAFTQQLQIENPKLWSVDTPYLYTLRCQILNNERVVDQYDTPFGIRSGVFDVNKGFLLNGTLVKLKGVCLHGDGGGVGVAVPEGVWIRRLQLLKEMGCNAIRTSHNPPAPEFLDLCDQMGFLVMDEAFDAWEEGKRLNDFHLHFKEWSQRDLVDFIRRDRNHPSVILWSAGNEIGEQVTNAGVAILKKLVDTFHHEDPTRPVTAGCDRVNAEPRAALPQFLSVLDVVGYNYVNRWRDWTDKYYSADRQNYPERKFVGTEIYSMAGVRGNYDWLFDRPTTTPAVHSRYQQPPAVNLHLDVEQFWKFVRINDYASGDFMWTGIDYLGEAYWPNKIATFGCLDTCGFKKDGYYFYQSQWTSTPVLHLMPHWNLKKREGEIIPVTCYTNCDTVELFLNGKSYGVKGYEFPRYGMEKSYGILPQRAYIVRTTSDLHLSWDVPYQPGTLRVVGTIKGKTITEEISTTGEPAGIKLSVDKMLLSPDARDVAHFTVEVVDDKGRTVPTADNSITLELTGPARILCVDNGNPATDESFKADHRKAFNGMCLAIVQSTTDSGVIQLTARSNGLTPATVQVDSKKIKDDQTEHAP